MKTFLISDSHFGHKNILKYEPEARQYDTVDEMNNHMIERWNTVVGKNDRVIHLGDFCFGEKYLPLAGELNGTKYLIMGNHDVLQTDKYLQYFHKVLGSMQYGECILTHFPIHESQFYRFKANIHGHMHSKHVTRFGLKVGEGYADIPDTRYINVSTEVLHHVPIEDKVLFSRIPR